MKRVETWPTLGAFLRDHKGQYAKIGAHSGFVWIGDISENTAEEFDRKASILKSGGVAVPANDRAVLSIYKSSIDTAWLVKVEGSEHSNLWETRSKPQPEKVPDERYVELYGAIIGISTRDMRDAIGYFIDARMKTPMIERNGRFGSERKWNDAVEVARDAYKSFGSPLFKYVRYSPADLVNLCKKAAWEMKKDKYKEKAEAYEKRIEKKKEERKSDGRKAES